jgi:hypothetical protein
MLRLFKQLNGVTFISTLKIVQFTKSLIFGTILSRKINGLLNYHPIASYTEIVKKFEAQSNMYFLLKFDYTQFIGSMIQFT